jgi:hypothetical protein
VQFATERGEGGAQRLRLLDLEDARSNVVPERVRRGRQVHLGPRIDLKQTSDEVGVLLDRAI